MIVKKIHYISKSPLRLAELSDYEITRGELSQKLLPSEAEVQSDLVLIDHSDLVQSDQQLLAATISALQKCNKPVLLLNRQTTISNYESLELVRSGLNGLVTIEIINHCFEMLSDLKPVKLECAWDVTLSLIDPFAQATSEVIDMTFGSKTSLLGVVNGRIIPPKGEVSSSMTFAGEVDGTTLITFSRNQMCKLVTGLIASTEEEITDEDLFDGVNEVINQVSGRVRTMEWPDKYKFNIDLPRLIESNEIESSYQSDAAWITLLFECYGQIFAVSIRAEKVDKPVEMFSQA